MVHGRRSQVGLLDGDGVRGGEDVAGESFDGVDGGAVAETLRDRNGEFGLRERGAVGGEVASEQVGDPFVGGDGAFPDLGVAVLVEADGFEPPDVCDLDRLTPHGGDDESFGVGGSPAERFGFDLPAGVEAFGFTFGLVAPGGQHRCLATLGGVGGAGRLQPGVDFVGSLGERVQDVLGDAGDLGDVHPGMPLDAQPAGQFVAVDRLEHLTSCTRMPVDLRMNQRRPLAVGALHDVRDQYMPVQQRVARARGAMPERRGDHPAGSQASGTSGRPVVFVEACEVGEIVRPALHPHRFTFQVADGNAHRRFARFDHCALDARVVRHRIQHARRLRCLERQVEPGHPARVRPQRLTVRCQPAGSGTQPGEHGPQIIRIDLAAETEPAGAAADPLAVGFTGAGVVVAQRLGDAGQVVGLLADAELGD